MPLLDGPRLDTHSGNPAKSLVVFLHGYGADGSDLIAIGSQLAPLLPDTAFVAPNAPERCAMSPVGYQWFPLTMRDPTEYELGVEQATPILTAFLNAELERYGLTHQSVALVGFSQGTMMALHVGPRMASALAGIVGFSGLLAAPGALAADAKSKPPVLLIHGDQDEVLPIDFLPLAVNGLKAAGFSVEAHVSQGLGHGIDAEGLALGARFLVDKLSIAASDS